MSRYAALTAQTTVTCAGCGTRVTPDQLWYAHPEYQIAMMELSGFWDAGRLRPVVTVCSAACDAMVLARNIQRSDYPAMDRTEILEDVLGPQTVIVRDSRRGRDV